LDEVIEDIRKLMTWLAETISKERLSIRKEVATTMQKQQQGDGANEQLQKFVWDIGIFQQLRWESHEQELMNFCS
jgi:hypothetical protein